MKKIKKTNMKDVIKINLGCGKEIKEGFDGVDIVDFGQKHILDIRKGLPFKDNSVDEVYSRYFVPCLTNYGNKFERVKFFNELYRVMKPDAIATIIVPAWNAAGGYGNPTFQEPLYEGALLFLNKEWRGTNVPEFSQYTCDFEPTWGYNMHPSIIARNQEYQQFALTNYCNSALDLLINLKKKPKKKSNESA
jgi:hypothetical protein